jgi:hypothetical protein
MTDLSKLDLFYFNKNYTKPIVFITTKITNNNEEIILDENSENLFRILIENNLSEDSDILIFNVIKEHKGKIINWILPSVKSNKKLVKQIENNTNLVNKIISETMKNSFCNTVISLKEQKENKIDIYIRDCNVSLGFMTEIYF